MSAPTSTAPPIEQPRPAPRRTEAEVEARAIRFRRAITLLLMTLVVPGSAQLSAGNRQLGRIALRVFLALVCALVGLLALWLFWPNAVLRVVTSAPLLWLLRWTLVLLSVAWLALFVDAWRLGRPLTLARDQRLKLFGLTGVLCLVTVTALLVSSSYVGTAHSLVAGLFGNGTGEGVKQGRYNVLLLGGDAGADRWGLRPDSITVASVDADTGQSVLLGLPRNLQNVPFPKGTVMRDQWPRGFDCGDECLLNAVYTWAETHKELFDGTDEEARPGIQATRDAVEAITGLQISYTVAIDLQGFQSLIDAVGGIDLEVMTRTPIGGGSSKIEGWIQPGVQHLDGFHALWFARARAGSNDYDRMSRQKCVMSAMLKQLDPISVLTNFQGLASASAATIWTDVPAANLPSLLSLAREAKGQAPRVVQFVPPDVQPVDPDYRRIRSMVKEATESEATASPTSPSAQTVVTGSGGTTAPPAATGSAPTPATGTDAAAPTPVCRVI